MIPEKVKIGGITFDIRRDCDRELTCANLDGEIRYAMQEIALMQKTAMNI